MVIVAELDLVIDFYAVLDDRVTDGAAVYRRIGPDFDIVADDHTAELRHLQIRVPVPDKTKPVCTDDYTGMQNIVVADDTAFTDGHIGKQPGI